MVKLVEFLSPARDIPLYELALGQYFNTAPLLLL